MGGATDFVNGSVLYVNTDDSETRLTTCDLKTLQFYTNTSAGVYGTPTNFTQFNNTVQQMRYRSDGTWLAVRTDNENFIYFMKNSSAIDHTVDVVSTPKSLAWVYDDDMLAVGLANGSIAVLQRIASNNTFHVH